MHKEDSTTAVSASAPFDFRLSNQQGQTVMYTRVQQQGMTLELHNTSRGHLTIAARPAAPATSVSGPDFHLQLRFRSGTLWQPEKVELEDEDWKLSCNQAPADKARASASERLDDVVFYLRYKGDKPLTIDSGHRQRLSLRNIAADGRSGSHGTRVELKYQHLQSAGHHKALHGTCMHYVSVLDESPADEPGTAPILVDWVGPDTFLNDGTGNTRTLRFYNQSGGDLKLQAAKIRIELPVGEDDSGWALITKADRTSVAMEGLTKWKETGDRKQSVDGHWLPIELATDLPSLASNAQVDIPLTLATRCHSGRAYIKVHYEGFGHLQGTRHVAVHKATLVCSPAFTGETGVPGQYLASVSGESPLTIKSATASALLVRSPADGGYGLEQRSGQTVLKTWVSPERANIGTDSAHKLNLTTKGLERVTIDSEGKVGIGTTKPLTTLHVAASSAKADAATTRALAVTTNDTSKPFALDIRLVGAAALSGRAAYIQSTDFDSEDGGNILLQPGGGNVGIGIANPGSNRLQVAGGPVQLDGNLTVGGTSTVKGDVTVSGTATFKDNVTISPNKSLTVSGNVGRGVMTISVPHDYQTTIGSDTSLFYNAGGGAFHRFQINGVPAMTINKDGKVGIGTETPTRAALQIESSVKYSNNNMGTFMHRKGYENYAGGAWEQNSEQSVSLYCSGIVVSGAFGATASDSRIKNVLGHSDGSADLATLIALEITDYVYRDSIGKGRDKHKKVIAQQVEGVYPQAVHRNTDVVPDIYRHAAVAGGWVQLATDLQVGERVRLIAESEEGIHEVLEVCDGAFRTAFAPPAEDLFVYGREVDDFGLVDYDALSMLNVSATQELARRLAAKDAEIAALQQQLGEQAARLSRLELIEARLARLELAAPGAGSPLRAMA